MPPTTRQLDQVSAAGSDTCGLITRRMCADAWDVAMLAPPADPMGISCGPLLAMLDATSCGAGARDASQGGSAKKDACGRGKALAATSPHFGPGGGEPHRRRLEANGHRRRPQTTPAWQRTA